MRGDTKPQNLSSAMPARNAEKHGPPRPTKMCNIASLWRYDVRADHTKTREYATVCDIALRLRAAVFPRHGRLGPSWELANVRCRGVDRKLTAGRQNDLNRPKGDIALNGRIILALKV
jgi:hypothetical protein